MNEVRLDSQVLGWTALISLLTGIIAGVAPALTVLRRNVQLFREQRERTASRGLAHRGTRRAFVVAQFAIAVVVLATAGLLVRSWLYVERLDLGFRPERVLSMQLATAAFVGTAQRADFYGRVLEQIESVPGVESAGIIGDLFVSNGIERVLTSDVNGGTTSERLRLRIDEVSERLFTTLGTRLLRGRFFSVEDGPDSPRVAIVNDAMARLVWPGLNPVGRRFKLGRPDSDNPWFMVVGVVGDMRRQGSEVEPIPQMFEPLDQNPSGLETLLVRTSTDDPLEMVDSVKAAVRRVDKRVPLYGITTVEERLRAYLAQRRFQTALLVAFAVVALVLAAVGIYGLIYYSVTTRVQEIGIRMAVGASRRNIFRLIVLEGVQLSLTGVILGLVAALWIGRTGASLLFGVSAGDPLTFVTISTFLMLLAVAASFFPARRAMRLNPMSAVRCE